MRNRLSVSVVFAAVALVVAIPVAPAAAKVPDPLKPGKLGVNVVEYDAGEIALTVPQLDGTSASFTQPLEGSVTFPTSPGPWPVVLFLHGRHTTCIDAGAVEYIPEAGSPEVQCPDAFGPDGEQLQTRIRSYAGYGYLASLLASRGYAVVSPGANVIASFDAAAPDGGIAARTQVIGATLDLMRRWSNGAGPSNTIGTRLTGRLDLTRVALMGHSRGAEGVTQYIAFNQERSTVYPLNGVISVAPTDATAADPFRNGGTNLAELLPACDGDVFFLAGGHVFERVKDSPQGQPFTKLQWLVQGTNHNFFNTVWSGADDALETPVTAIDSACNPASPTGVRLDPADQRRVGAALMAAFIRYFEGGEGRFRKIVTGATYPDDALRSRAIGPLLVARAHVSGHPQAAHGDRAWRHRAHAAQRARRGDPGKRPVGEALRSDLVSGRRHRPLRVGSQPGSTAADRLPRADSEPGAALRHRHRGGCPARSSG